MKKLIFSALLAMSSYSIFAQNQKVEEGKPLLVNGIEYGYNITNEKTIEIDNNTYQRYEISFYAKSTGCDQYFQHTGALQENLIANFYGKNATGRKLSAKEASITLQPFTTKVEVEENGKQVLKTATIGYSLRQGEAASKSVVMIVPKNSRPIIECDVKFLRKM